MGPWETWPRLAAAAVLLALTTVPGAAAKAECRNPIPDYKVEFPQGSGEPIKLYQSNKGGRVGSVAQERIAGRLLLCSDPPGSVNEVLLPKGTAIDLDAGKSATADDRYWVRNNQVRFSQEEAQKAFVCERNQVKVRVAGGAAGGEECKP